MDNLQGKTNAQTLMGDNIESLVMLHEDLADVVNKLDALCTRIGIYPHQNPQVATGTTEAPPREGAVGKTEMIYRKIRSEMVALHECADCLNNVA